MHIHHIMNGFLLALAVAGLTACGGVAQLPVAAGIGANPVLPQPERSLIPVVNIAPAKGWPADGKPIAAPGTVVTRFAEGLDHPRWIMVLPNGDVLVAETNAPPKPEDTKGIIGGIKNWIMKMVMRKAGPVCPARIAFHCCVISTATALPTLNRYSSMG